MHRSPTCPGLKPKRTWPRLQITTPAQYLADFERVFQRLAADVADHDLDDLAVHDWPRTDPQVLIQLVTIREQLECLLGRILRWAQEDDAQLLAAPLLQAIRDLLRTPPRLVFEPLADLLRPGFVAPRLPPRTISPPPAMRLAIERLKAAHLLPIDLEHLSDDGNQSGRDQRLLAFWLHSLDNS